MERNAPFVLLYRAERSDHAETRRALVVAEHDLAAHAAHFQLACHHRDLALDAAREASERAENNMADYIDEAAKVRRLEETLTFICDATTREMEA